MAARAIYVLIAGGFLAVFIAVGGAPFAYAADKTPPDIVVFHVNDGEIQSANRSVRVQGQVTDGSGVRKVTVDGRPVELNENRFARRVLITNGEKRVRIEAVDNAGNRSQVMVTVVHTSKTRRVSRRRTSTDEEVANFDTAAGPEDNEGPAEKGYFMELRAGGTVVHSVSMPTLEACRKAIEFSPKAKCVYRGVPQ
ncbi:MAG: hypothetical protein O3A84_11630 [Proteobacteria bacterium]|nr:hypothetical protein [Pseudomonadota bacterium]